MYQNAFSDAILFIKKSGWKNYVRKETFDVVLLLSVGSTSPKSNEHGKALGDHNAPQRINGLRELETTPNRHLKVNQEFTVISLRWTSLEVPTFFTASSRIVFSCLFVTIIFIFLYYHLSRFFFNFFI